MAHGNSRRTLLRKADVVKSITYEVRLRRTLFVVISASLLRDAVDLRLVADVRRRRGDVNSQSELGGCRGLKSTPARLNRDATASPKNGHALRA